MKIHKITYIQSYTHTYILNYTNEVGNILNLYTHTYILNYMN